MSPRNLPAEEQSFAGVLASLQTVQSEQQRIGIVIAGLQRDMGDVVTGQAAQEALLRGGVSGEGSLLVRVTLTEQAIREGSDQLNEHRRFTERRLDQIGTALDKIGATLENRESERLRQAQDNWKSALGWLVALLCSAVAVIASMAHH